MAALNQCRTRECLVVFPPDIQVYSIQDRLIFNTTPLSFIVNCPAGFVCAPGTFPRVITYPVGTFALPAQPPTPGFDVVISMQGCQNTVTLFLPPDATAAEILAAQEMAILDVAQQQAECDAILIEPIPNPAP